MEERFNYTYSAKEQQEILCIREKYAAPKENKMEQLRALDRKTSQKAQAWAIAVGVLGALVMGAGMSLVMTELGSALGSAALFLGIAAGVLGMAGVALAYPVYGRVLKAERKRIAPQVLQLTEELLQ